MFKPTKAGSTSVGCYWLYNYIINFLFLIVTEVMAPLKRGASAEQKNQIKNQ